MMIAAKPACVVHVAATISLTVAGPVPLRLRVRPATGLLLVPLLILIRGPGVLLLTLGLLLLMLIRRPGLLLVLRSLVLRLRMLLRLRVLLLTVLLLRGLGMLLLFRSLGLLLVLLLPCVRGDDCSKKKEQNSRADETGAFHVCCLR